MLPSGTMLKSKSEPEGTSLIAEWSKALHTYDMTTVHLSMLLRLSGVTKLWSMSAVKLVHDLFLPINMKILHLHCNYI